MLAISLLLLLRHLSLSQGLPTLGQTDVTTTNTIITLYTTVDDTLTVTTLVPLSVPSSSSSWTDTASKSSVGATTSAELALPSTSSWTDTSSNFNVGTTTSPTTRSSTASSQFSSLVAGTFSSHTWSNTALTTVETTSIDSSSHTWSATSISFATTTTATDSSSHSWSGTTSTTMTISIDSSSHTWSDTALTSGTDSSSPSSHTWSDTTSTATTTTATDSSSPSSHTWSDTTVTTAVTTATDSSSPSSVTLSDATTLSSGATTSSTKSSNQSWTDTTLTATTTTTAPDSLSYTWSGTSSTATTAAAMSSSSHTWSDTTLSTTTTTVVDSSSHTWSGTTVSTTSATSDAGTSPPTSAASGTSSPGSITTSGATSGGLTTGPQTATGSASSITSTSTSSTSTSMLSTVTCHQPRPTEAPSAANLLIAMTGYSSLPNPWINWACVQFSTPLFENSTTAGTFGIDKERIIYGQGSDMYVLTLSQSSATQRFCHPAIADIFQECIFNSSNYGGVWWNENEMYNLTNPNFPGSPIVGSSDPSCTQTGGSACATGTSSTLSGGSFMSGTTALGLTATPSLSSVTLTVTGTLTGSAKATRTLIRGHPTAWHA